MQKTLGLFNFKRAHTYFLLILLTLFTQFSPAQVACREVLNQRATFKQQNNQVRAEKDIKQLILMAFNVENLFVSTGKQNWKKPGEQEKDESQPPKPKSEKELERIREIIKEADADFLVLTEVESIEALQVLATKQLQGKYKPYLIEGNDARGIDIGFLVKADLPWVTKHITHKDLEYRDPKTNQIGPLFSRDLPVLEVRRNASDRDPLFVIVGNHAKSKRNMDGDFESTQWRTAQYVEAAKIIQRDYRTKGIRTIMAGDFNTDIRFDPEVKPIKQILQSSLEVAPDAVPEDQRFTHTFFPRGEKGQPEPPPERNQMDDIMVSPDITVISSRIIKYKDDNGQEMPIANTYQERKQQPSDHYPVRAVISTEGFF